VRRHAITSEADTGALTAVLDAALDAVVMMDADGRVLHFNPAAERTFGYSAQETIGRDMAALIIPPTHRDAHRRGLERHLDGGDPVVLDRRVELTGMRSDGSEFPLELTVTRIAGAEPRFLGYLRDISERRRTEADLKASRARLVTAGYEARRRIERDLHDGAQQHLVMLAMTLRLVRGQLDDGTLTAELVDEAITELADATAELRELARGIHPAVLSQGGLRPALRALTRRVPVPVELADVPEGRWPAAVEATAYFVVAEALTNVARYAEATAASVSVRQAGDRLVVRVSDDGRGGADPDSGSGLTGLRDRLDALGGALTVDSPVGRGTTVVAEVPCAS
jgi:PAS domain S-box-containing protein